MTRACVVGAGLSGLVTAWGLARRGFHVEIVEREERPGGLIHTAHLPQGLAETGANAFVWTPAVARLFADLGVAPQFARDGSRRRYIFRGGRARRWPLKPIETVAAVARLGRSWAAGATRPLPRESADAWGRRVLGAGATDWLLSPALNGIFAAPAASLSAEAIGLGARRARPTLAVPAGGMGALIDALVGGLNARGAELRCGDEAAVVAAGMPAVICTGARAAAALLAPHQRELANAVARIRTLPLIAATAFFDPHPADLQGFGVLFPRGTARALGVLFDTEIFEDRGPWRVERWIYGDPGLLGCPDDAVAAAILEDRELLTGRRGALAAVHVSAWRDALPLYDQAVVDARAAASSMPPWLGVCGNYLGEIGVSALIERAETQAGRLAAAAG